MVNLVLFFFLLINSFLLKTNVNLFHPVYALNPEGHVETDIECEKRPFSVFIPRLSYKITFPSPDQRQWIKGCTAEAMLFDRVGEDAEAMATSCEVNSLNSSGYLLIQHRTPSLKISGFFCQTQDRAGLSAQAAAGDNPNIDIAISRPDEEKWQGENKIDHNSKESVVFGDQGLVSSLPVVDGQDYDKDVNGEIVFGGSEDVSQGASRFFVRYKVFGRDEASKDEQHLFFNFFPEN